MKKTILLLVFLVSTFFNAKAQTSTYQKIYGGPRNDLGFSVAATFDSGYVFAGYTTFILGGTDILVFKLDHLGNKLWSRVYGGTGNDEAIGIIQTSDSGLAIIGKTASFGAGGFDLLLIKTDSGGGIQWMKTYGGAADESALRVHQTSDNGFICSGSTSSFGQGLADMLYIKTNETGDTTWTKILGGPSNDQGTDAEETADGGFIFSARVVSWGAGSFDVFLAKTDVNGDTLWTHTYGSTNWDEGMNVKQIADGSYIVIGNTFDFTLGNFDAFMCNVDTIGNLVWSKVYAGNFNDAIYDLIQLDDGGYILAGETQSFGPNHQKQGHIPAYPQSDALFQDNHVFGTDNSNVMAIRTDAYGDTIWTKVYGGVTQDEGYCIIRTDDDGFMLAAYGTSFSPNDSIEYYLIKADTNGFSGCNFEDASPAISTLLNTTNNPAPVITQGLIVNNIVTTNIIVSMHEDSLCFTTGINEHTISSSSISIFPNPVITKARIKVPARYVSNVLTANASVYNMLGMPVKNYHYNQTEEMQIDVKELSAGIYFLKLELKLNKEKTNFVFNTKFVVE